MYISRLYIYGTWGPFFIDLLFRNIPNSNSSAAWGPISCGITSLFKQDISTPDDMTAPWNEMLEFSLYFGICMMNIDEHFISVRIFFVCCFKLKFRKIWNIWCVIEIPQTFHIIAAVIALTTNIYYWNSSAPFKNIFLNCNNSLKISIYGSNLFITFNFITLNHKFQLKNPLKHILELVKMTSVLMTSRKTAWRQQKRRKTGTLPTYVLPDVCAKL